MEKNNKIAIAGLAFVLLGMLFFLMGGAGEGVQKVVSDDGLAELEIPADALPEGISINDISITNISEGDSILAYALKPDGTVFTYSPTFKTVLNNNGNTVPTPFLLSKEGGLEPLLGAVISIDLTKNETAVSVPLPHFSVLEIPTRSDRAFFSATMDTPREVYVGDPVSAKATLNKQVNTVVLFSELNPWAVPLYDDEKRLLLGSHNLGYKVARDSVHVSGKASATFLPDAVGPYQYVYGYPPPSPFVGDSMSVRSSNDFRCEKLGTGAIQFTFDLTYDAEGVDVISSGDPGGILKAGSSLGLKRYKQKGGGVVSVLRELECIARPAVGGVSGGGVSESESKAVGDIIDETPPQQRSSGAVKICGLPGGPACPPKK